MNLNLTFLIQLYLVILCSVLSVLASPASMVLRGMVLREALPKAKMVCPEKLVGKHSISRLKQRINDLMAPAKSSTDPFRKTYIQQVPQEEAVRKMINELCQIQENYEILQEMEQAEEAGEVEENLSNELESGSFALSEDSSMYRSLFLFFLGMVCGMFFVFGYFSFYNKATSVNANKSLRRPEL